MKEKRILFVTILCILTFAGFVQAEKPGGAAMGGERMERQEREGAVPPGRWWQMPRVEEKLGLTAEEKTKLDSLYYDNRGKMIDLKGTVSKAQLELEQILDSESLNEANALSQFRKLLNARDRMAEARFAHLLKVRQVLGNERFQKLKMSFRQMMGKKKGRNGKRGKMHGDRDHDAGETP